jgi:hypothetical protein
VPLRDVRRRKLRAGGAADEQTAHGRGREIGDARERRAERAQDAAWLGTAARRGAADGCGCGWDGCREPGWRLEGGRVVGRRKDGGDGRAGWIGGVRARRRRLATATARRARARLLPLARGRAACGRGTSEQAAGAVRSSDARTAAPRRHPAGAIPAGAAWPDAARESAAKPSRFSRQSRGIGDAATAANSSQEHAGWSSGCTLVRPPALAEASARPWRARAALVSLLCATKCQGRRRWAAGTAHKGAPASYLTLLRSDLSAHSTASDRAACASCRGHRAMSSVLPVSRSRPAMGRACATRAQREQSKPAGAAISALRAGVVQQHFARNSHRNRSQPQQLAPSKWLAAGSARASLMPEIKVAPQEREG